MGLFNTAALPAGILTKDQAKVIGAPSASVEPLPFKVTVVPIGTVRLAPALATGAEALVLMVTVADPLKPNASVTVSSTT